MRTKLLFLTLLLTAVTALAQFAQTETKGDDTRVASRIITTKPCKLWAAFGYNGNTNTQYIYVFESGVAPTNGQSCKFGPFPVGADQFYSIDLSFYGAVFTNLTIGISTTANLYTNSATNCTIQAIFSRLQ